MFTLKPLSYALVGMMLSSQTQMVRVPEATPVTVVLTEGIASNTHVAGEPLSLEVYEDVLVEGRVVIKKGTPVKGEIHKADKSGKLGKSGSLVIRIESTTTINGEPLALRGSQVKKGGKYLGVAVALVASLGFLGTLIRGRDVRIKAGTKIKVYTDEEKQLPASRVEAILLSLTR